MPHNSQKEHVHVWTQLYIQVTKQTRSARKNVQNDCNVMRKYSFCMQNLQNMLKSRNAICALTILMFRRELLTIEFPSVIPLGWGANL